MLRQELRRTFREKRNALSPHEQHQAATAIVDIWRSYAEPNINVQKVAIYLSTDAELNTSFLIEYFWKNNTEVYLPVIHPFTKGYLLFLKYTRNTPMKTNQFGILEPILDITQMCLVEELDVIFTPLVAFDQSGNRLGMGGGFYDRTLVKLNNKPSTKKANTRIIGLAHNCQKTVSLPVETWDIPLPYILSPSHFYTF
ncbi:5-formyltetrahydrofolate cyclo-ligase [Glaciecola sp. 2405UD65-10]|uniref:5-formyltetrahydrofolate cyclo-ligase n=1 Tax=Glaciecola sp. 2405UD65-10 TaxID=3397244 RepID=UPI003B5C32B2